MSNIKAKSFSIPNSQFSILLKERILVLDGGMGTMIQEFGLTEDAYRGERFADSQVLLKGNHDLLNLTNPDVIRNIQRQYLEAGADILTTNTLNANALSMEDYGLQSFVQEMNLEAARLARETADDYMAHHPERTIFVAGSLGPTNKTTSISADVQQPAYRAVGYMDMYRIYKEQAEALIEGGVDILLFETIFDTLNLKAGLEAAMQVMRDKKYELPVMVSLTLSGKGGRTLSGQTLNAFLASIQHVPLTCVGLNCSFGASEMKPFLQELAHTAPYYISAYPNAGLPNALGQYDETPESFAEKMKEFVDEGLVNIIGGCCGTTPSHIASLRSFVKGAKPHLPVRQPDVLRLSGLERLEVKPENNFITIGERCNVAGSRKFLRLIKEKNHDGALAIARKQVENGAQVIDINMDDGLLDATAEMKTFLNLIASEPDIARVPVMIDSSKWEVIEQGLMCVQGKSIVNSISLKEGEALFLAHAGRIRQLGAAVIVMAFDEQGQADTYERKIDVCKRAYHLLTERIGFPPQDIIFDPNVLAIATGMPEHNSYGIDFIRAVSWIKQHLPGAKVSGGVSNLSFSFRGNDPVREAMHAVFLYHAIRAGMDMGIVNPSSSVMYEDIEPVFRTLLEDVVLARRLEAVDDLTEQTDNG
ncbi:MAG: homocysteine S-methyltransferase family protein, partial [Tannerella sp.]|nr:homocysteine S-methyltransferase family protein [Tannerella sp.]